MYHGFLWYYWILNFKRLFTTLACYVDPNKLSWNVAHSQVRNANLSLDGYYTKNFRSLAARAFFDGWSVTTLVFSMEEWSISFLRRSYPYLMEVDDIFGFLQNLKFNLSHHNICWSRLKLPNVGSF